MAHGVAEKRQKKAESYCHYRNTYYRIGGNLLCQSGEQPFPRAARLRRLLMRWLFVENRHEFYGNDFLYPVIGCRGKLNHVGREESGYHRNGNDYGINKTAYHVQRHAERCNYKCEFADLRHTESALHRTF